MNEKYEHGDDVTVQLEATVVDHFDDGWIDLRLKDGEDEPTRKYIMVQPEKIVSED